MFDGKAFGEEMVAIVREYLEAEIASLRTDNEALRAEKDALAERITALEAREMPEAIKGEPGEVDMADIEALIVEHVEECVAALPPSEKGEPGEPGKDVDMEEVAKRIESAAQAAVAALPAPERGESGKDGAGLADALKDAEGNLVLVMTDGRTKSLGPIDGKDGSPGKDGETFTLDDFDVEPIDERTIKLGFTKGDTKHSFELEFPVLIGRGIWNSEEKYARGDVVSWGGSAWEAVEPEVGVKPDLSKGGWRLLVKRGRDGKGA